MIPSQRLASRASSAQQLKHRYRCRYHVETPLRSIDLGGLQPTRIQQVVGQARIDLSVLGMLLQSPSRDHDWDGGFGDKVV